MADDPAGEGLVDIDGRQFYAIVDFDAMDPFLMSVVSDGDRWLFVSSTGALTAGRVDSSGALFPYETDDRLHAAADRVGPVTAIRAVAHGRPWRPFAANAEPGTQRRLAKSVYGECVRFEERHPVLGLTFAYRWESSRAHGFVRTATLTNTGPETIQIELVDGLHGLLPHGLEPTVYQRLSNLSHAYKRSEIVDGAGGRLAVYSLEAPVSDSAEPQEVLRATTVWSAGLEGASLTLDPGALRRFEAGMATDKTSLLTGRPGAYLLQDQVELAPGQSCEWQIVADVGQDHTEIVDRLRWLESETALVDELRAGTGATTETLERTMAAADASQRTNAPIACAHHVANVTYNVMRGGIPQAGYRVETADFARFVAEHNRVARTEHAAWLAGLPSSMLHADLLAHVAGLDDPNLTRLALTYLPFTFSRRHGDPSRPWNAFAIHVHDAEGRPLLHFEGNWRDVFQNWEALCWSFPHYLPSVIALFLNASTADGHNPYRITRSGVDWEVPDPDDPWANIGYWGDHQLIYLLRLLEAADRFLPGELAQLFEQRCFTYADVPYRIAPFADLVADPKATIVFDHDAHGRSMSRVSALGADGRLLADDDGTIVRATMLEKLLVTVLARLANFVADGGIWLNTQRPEWNDANNALVGFGLSMVTLHHLRQFIVHLRRITHTMSDAADRSVATEVVAWLDGTVDALRSTAVPSADGADDQERRRLLEALGSVASDYRGCIYERGFAGSTEQVNREAIVELCDLALAHVDATLHRSRRPGGLVHSYNLIDFGDRGDTAIVRHLPEMLEGQVAALGSGVLAPEERAELLDALFTSRLYRDDQRTFLLAPATRPPAFLDKNVVPSDLVETNVLLDSLIAAGDRTIVRRDADGRYRFHPDLIDDEALEAALDRLATVDRWSTLVVRHRQETLDAYEAVFDHRSFLGRSTAMYAYEGIGSIYWHMVGKLLVATQESVFAAADDGAAAATVARLSVAYERVRAGLGFNKSAGEFGAIPTDPYSHTPAHAGAQQPGMTGAVKEELLARPAELGVRVVDGEIRFDPLLLRSEELLEHPTTWTVIGADGESLRIELEAGSLGLTICQVPVIVGQSDGEPWVEVELADGRAVRRSGAGLGAELSAEVFGRSGAVRSVRAMLPMTPS